jgi:hypothetical protein
VSRQLRPAPHCLNCGAAVATRFCHDCGQENTSYRVSLGRLVGDLFEEVFQLESRLWRTAWALVRHPGLLTREYSAGRRVSYTTPLRLYLMMSVVYFFVAAVVPPRAATRAEIKVGLSEHQVDIDHLPPATNWLDKRVRERLGVTDRLDPVEADRRARELLINNTPKVLAVLVPMFALILMLFFRRRFYVEHLVFSLHVHALYFAIGALAALTRSRSVDSIAQLAAVGWAYVAMHAVYGQSWLRTAWKALLITMLYSILVGIGVAGALLLGLFL